MVEKMRALSSLGRLPGMTDSIITHAELARLLGISTRAVSDLWRRGIVVRSGKGYALAASVQKYTAHLRTLATGRGGDEAAIKSAPSSAVGWRRRNPNTSN